MNWENWFHLKIFHHCEKWPCPSRFIWSTIGISKTWVIWMNRNKKFITEGGNSGVITKTIYRRDKQPSYLNQLVWHSQTHLFISFSTDTDSASDKSRRARPFFTVVKYFEVESIFPVHGKRKLFQWNDMIKVIGIPFLEAIFVTEDNFSGYYLLTF